MAITWTEDPSKIQWGFFERETLLGHNPISGTYGPYRTREEADEVYQERFQELSQRYPEGITKTDLGFIVKPNCNSEYKIFVRKPTIWSVVKKAKSSAY